MIKLLAILLLCSACHGIEYCFDPGCPNTYKRAMEAALVRNGGDFKAVKATPYTKGILHFAWTAGAWTNADNMHLTAGALQVNQCYICWTQFGTDGGKTRWVTFTKQFWGNKQVDADRLDYELSIALRE